MRNLINIFKTCNLLPVIDHEALHEELNKIIDTLNDINYSTCIEGWKDVCVANEFIQENNKFKNGPVRTIDKICILNLPAPE